MDVNKFLDVMSNGKKIKNDVKSFKDMSKATNSIKAKARDLVLQYPVLVSNTLSQETVAAVSRALEHEYANLMVLLINNENVQGGPSTGDYLKGFHNNVLESGNIPDLYLKNAHLDLLNETSDILFNKESLNDLSINSTKMKIYKEADDDSDSRNDAANPLIRDMKNMIDANEKKRAAMSNTDVRKLNDMSPTIVRGNITVTPAGASVSVEKPINFGVKAMTHLLDSDEIITNLANNIGDATLLVKFIEFTSGEKRLFRDLIMRKEDMKALATSKGKGAHWFRKLHIMATNAKIKKAWAKLVKLFPIVGGQAAKLAEDRVPIPTMSLVISKSEVDQIRSKTGIDLLRKENDIKDLIDKLYLLTFIIVDDTTEMVYLYDDVSRRYVTYSVKQLKGFAKDDLLTPEQAMKRSLMR